MSYDWLYGLRLPKFLRFFLLWYWESVFLGYDGNRISVPKTDFLPLNPRSQYATSGLFPLINNDNTIKYKNKIIQILKDAARISYAKCEVTVHEHQDGSLSVYYGPKMLQIKILRNETGEGDDYVNAI